MNKKIGVKAGALKTTVLGFSILISLAGTAYFRKQKNEIVRFEAELQKIDQEQTLSEDGPFISILIPARNEQNHIEECLVSILEQDYPHFEVLAIDDNSTDDTPTLIAKLEYRYPNRLRLVKCSPPEGEWLGKNNALWQGYEQSNSAGQWLLFMDADTVLKPGALRVAVEYARSHTLDLLSLGPSLRLENFWSRVLAIEIGKFYNFSAHNPFYPAKPGSIEEANAVGPFILARREAYAAVDGHRAVKHFVLEDVELARRFRAKSFTTLFQAAFNYVEMKPYDDLDDLWESVSKNLFLVAHKNWGVIAYVIGVEWLYGLAPIILFMSSTINLLFFSSKGKKENKVSWLLNLTAVLLFLALHQEVGSQFQLPRRYLLFYPLAAVTMSVLMVYSALKGSVKKAVSWKSREIKI